MNRKVKKGYLFLVLLLVLAMAIVTFIVRAPRGVKLESKYVSGEILRYEARTNIKGTVTPIGPLGQRLQSSDIGIDMQIDSITKVLEVDSEGTADLEVSYNKLTQKIETPGQTTEIIADLKSTVMKQNEKVIYDSRFPRVQEQPPPLTRLIGQPITMKVAKNGKVLEIRGMENFKKLVPQIDLEQMVQQNQFQFPNKAVRIGESWTYEVPLNIPEIDEPITISVTSILKGFKKLKGYECAEIVVRVDAAFSDLHLSKFVSQPGQPPIKADVTIGKLTQKMDGVMFFAYKEGKLITSDQDMDTTIDMMTIMVEQAGKEETIKMSMALGTKVNMELE